MLNPLRMDTRDLEKMHGVDAPHPHATNPLRMDTRDLEKMHGVDATQPHATKAPLAPPATTRTKRNAIVVIVVAALVAAASLLELALHQRRHRGHLLRQLFQRL